MSIPFPSRVELNGRAVAAADLVPLAAHGYGHFTTMQVRAGAVRGLGLHLERLATATEALFARPLDLDATRRWMQQALGGVCESCTLRVTVFARGFDRRHPERPAEPDVLVATAPPVPAGPPLRVRAVPCLRELPEIKHLGTFPVLHQLREARQAGFDDILLVDEAGCVAEGSFWNVCFVQSGRVLWPDAPALPGVTARLVEAGLAQAGVASVHRAVALRALSMFDAAFAVNAGGIRPLVRVDEVELPLDTAWHRRLLSALEAAPAEII